MRLERCMFQQPTLLKGVQRRAEGFACWVNHARYGFDRMDAIGN